MTTNRRAAATALLLATTPMLLSMGILAARPADATSTRPGLAPHSHGQTRNEDAAHRAGAPNYDSRSATTGVSLRPSAAEVRGRSARTKALAASLGSRSVFMIDPLTGTPDNVSRTDGYLTGPDPRSPAGVALNFVRGHLAALGLTAGDLATLALRRSARDVHGVTHLSWVQSAEGIPVFGNGLRAHVAADGALVAVQGAPVSELRSTAAAAPAASLSGSSARRHALLDVGGIPDGPALDPSESARVWFLTAAGLRPAWSVITTLAPDEAYHHVIDAVNGRVLYRRDRVLSDKGDALVFDNYPGAPRGGRQHVVNLFHRGWLRRDATSLQGSSAYAWADIDDDGVADPEEQTPVPGTKQLAQFPLVRFPDASELCTPAYVCTWDPDTPYSWQANKNQDVTQAFYQANVFHDYLRRPPIGFTRAMGSFETRDGDPVLIHALNGAEVLAGLPCTCNINNAFMGTPPDGAPPHMFLLLWHRPGASAEQDPFLPGSAASDASILFHEYTHGLSNRLVVDASGNSTLMSLHASSMGEAWSDYFALDYLVTRGLLGDSMTPGEVLNGEYVSHGLPLTRSEAIDCPVGAISSHCVQREGANGGYTFGDFGGATGGPEPHADGEIWGQTLWDLRSRLGHRVTAAVVTEAMSLSPDDPTFLDERDAILLADQVIYRGRHQHAMWNVFAHRGLGWYASASGGNDNEVIEDFSGPPAPGAPRTTLTGQVTDDATSQPLSGVLVVVGGHPQWGAVTDAVGEYEIPSVVSGDYPEIIARSAGYDLGSVPAQLHGARARLDFALRRDWASSSGGSAVAAFTGTDYSFIDCGPAQAIDQSTMLGWSTDVDEGVPSEHVVPKYIVITLPRPVNVSGFGIDPTNTCTDPPTSAMGAYTIEVSSDGTSYHPVASGTFDSGDLGRLHDVGLDEPISSVTHVKVWIERSQIPAGADCTDPLDGPTYSGCTWMDMTELEVFGTPSGP